MADQKTRRDENFPVGSLLIPLDLRADVHAYYKYARIADDIADSPDTDATEKITRLDALGAALRGNNDNLALNDEEQEAVKNLRHCMVKRSLDPSLATDLLEAFRQDATNTPCRTWADLINYCQFSACPVGRFLLSLHDEQDGRAESDALCSALQILNHIQDASEDWIALKRVYMPSDWMNADATSCNDLNAPTVSSGLRLTFDRLLENTDKLLETASPLPRLIKRRGLAIEATLCIALARRLSRRLKRQDPIARKVSLSAMDWVYAGSAGFLRLIKP
jgi:farnesyl-diphosphate farnesyltransferase